MTALTARERTRRRRLEYAEERRREIAAREPPLQRAVTHLVCKAQYHDCVCERALDKPACDRMEGAARYIIDTVRLHDLRAKPS